MTAACRCGFSANPRRLEAHRFHRSSLVPARRPHEGVQAPEVAKQPSAGIFVTSTEPELLEWLFGELRKWNRSFKRDQEQEFPGGGTYYARFHGISGAHYLEYEAFFWMVLNLLGRHGWEMVSYHPDPSVTSPLSRRTSIEGGSSNGAGRCQAAIAGGQRPRRTIALASIDYEEASHGT